MSRLLAICALVLPMAGCSWFFRGEPVLVDYYVISDYQPLDSFDSGFSRSCVVLEDIRSFAKAFATTTEEGLRASLIPVSAFQNEMFLGVVRRSRENVFDLAVDSVEDKDGELVFRYTTQSKPPERGENITSLLVAVPRGDYSAVRFVENGEMVKVVPLAPRDNTKK